MICATLTWLRHHKSSRHQKELEETSKAFKDEPEWLVDQMLRRKQEELLRQWEDREKRLEEMRQKEKAVEDRSRKRRRMAEASGTKGEDEDAEWMLDDWEDRTTGPQDSLSGLSKESREVLERIGLGNRKDKGQQDDIMEENVKVGGQNCPHLSMRRN